MLGAHIDHNWLGYTVQRELPVYHVELFGPLDAGGLKGDLRKARCVEHLWPEHSFLNFLPASRVHLRVEDFHAARIHDEFHASSRFVDAAFGNWGFDFMIVS